MTSEVFRGWMNSRMQRAVAESSVSYCKLPNIILTSVWSLRGRCSWEKPTSEVTLVFFPYLGQDIHNGVLKNDSSPSPSVSSLSSHPPSQSPPPPHRLSPSSLSHPNRFSLQQGKREKSQKRCSYTGAPEKQRTRISERGQQAWMTLITRRL